MSGSKDLQLIADAVVGRQLPKTECQTSIILIGFMGCGKSSIGRHLARRLGCNFVDLDREVEQTAGLRIAQIFALKGEMAFRRLETQMLRKTIRQSAVIASGGGVVTRLENRALLAHAARNGTAIIYLKTSPDILAARIRRQPGKRPLIDGPGNPLDYEATKRRVEELLAMRTAFYEECATLIVRNDGRSFETVVNSILQVVGK